MPRPMLKDPAPLKWEASLVADQALCYEIDVVTPMFGGGAIAKQCDPDYPVRPSEVRGHLRFWWRALYGGRYATSQELAKAESAIWGSDTEKGRVAISVVILNKGKSERIFERVGARQPLDRRYPGYALFPFSGAAANRDRLEEPASSAQVGVRFRLDVRSCGLGEARFAEVSSSVAAWITYGGIGARTRRGCGALKCEHLAAIDLEPGGQPESIPFLTGSKRVVGKPTGDNALASWKTSVETYKDFRQGVGFARNRGENPPTPGRSRWPEPDSIRNNTASHRWCPRHQPRQTGTWFPRADLGLPIVFQFRDQREGDPGVTTLQGTGNHMRMASPVITRPYWDGSAWRPMILVLNAPHAWALGDLDLRGGAHAQVGRKQIELPATGKIESCTPVSGPIREGLVAFACNEWDTTALEVKP